MPRSLGSAQRISDVTDRTPERPEGGTHGLLFADLRGYTKLVDTRGATEATRLLERYRLLTRDVVAQYGGAEIKTEGDSFYVAHLRLQRPV